MGRRVVLAALMLAVCAFGATAATAALSPKQYKAKLALLGQESNASQALISTGLKSKKVPTLVRTLGSFADAQDKIANEVSALKPPKNAVTANKALAQGLHHIATAVRGVAKKIRGAKTIAQATAILNKDTSGAKAGAEVNAALTKLQKLGYA